MRGSKHRVLVAIAAAVLLGGALAVSASAGQVGAFVEDVRLLGTFQQEDGRHYYGWAVSELEDVDGDGETDWITGSPFVGANKRGVLDVRSGATGEVLFSMTGQANDWLSYAIADGGDVDADGTHDVLAGAPNRGPGYVYVLSGVDGSLLGTIPGQAQGDRFGYAVSSAGDVDGDGHDDVLVGAPAHAAGTGRAYVVSGADLTTGLLTIDGSSAGGRFGTAVDRSEDLDGDGAADLLVGARNAGPTGAGEVSAFSSDGGDRLWATGPGPTGVDFGLFFVAGVGDTNLDGTPDVYVGDFNDATFAGSGRAYVLSGTDGHALWQVAGGPGDGLGPGREAGDVDGDGAADLIVGSYTSSAGANNAGKVTIFSGADGSELRTITSLNAGENLGFDATTIGDVDDDGFPDQLLSAATRNVVYLVAGEPA